MTPERSFVVFLSLILFALLLRLPNTAQRPMHGDEAVHAIKFGALLEQNAYQYDPYEYHGPTLNYFTLIPAWLSGETTLAETDERTLRWVPLFFSLVLVGLIGFFGDSLTWRGTFFAGMFTAISPTMIFYSRYYIQEMLFVTFLTGAIVFAYRYFFTRKIGWGIVAAIFTGLMMATKETWVIPAGIMVAVLGAGSWWWQRKQDCFTNLQQQNKWQLGMLSVLAIAVAALFFSSFFANPRGAWDAVTTYQTYLDRAGNHADHFHPWYYYLKILLWSNFTNGFVWTEVFLLVLAGIGGYFAVSQRHNSKGDARLLWFLTLYTVGIMVVFSLLPYKTPWNMLAFYQGFLLLAGYGASRLLDQFNTGNFKWLVALFLLAGSSHLLWQAYQVNHVQHSEQSSPHIYAHPLTEITAVADSILAIADAQEEGRMLHTEVIFSKSDYWPFPWYLRDMKQVGWWHEVNFGSTAAPLILAETSLEEELARKLYETPPPGQRHLYIPIFQEPPQLRPGIPMQLYVRSEMWQNWKSR